MNMATEKYEQHAHEAWLAHHPDVRTGIEKAVVAGGIYRNAHADWLTSGTDKDSSQSFAGSDNCAACARMLSEKEWSDLASRVWDACAWEPCRYKRLYQVAWICPDCSGAENCDELFNTYNEILYWDPAESDCACECKECEERDRRESGLCIHCGEEAAECNRCETEYLHCPGCISQFSEGHEENEWDIVKDGGGQVRFCPECEEPLGTA
jgi:hypothetical protein